VDVAQFEDLLPEATFSNALEVKAEPWPRPPKVLDAARRVVYIHRNYHGTFREHFELDNFPFDVQTLHVDMRLHRSRFRTCALNLLPLEFRNVPLLSEWDLLPPSASLEHARRSNASVSVELSLRRQPGFYIQKIFSMLSLLTSLGFTSFLLPTGEMFNRVSLCISVLFTLIAFMFTNTSTIPRVNYATVVDIHQLACVG